MFLLLLLHLNLHNSLNKAARVYTKCHFSHADRGPTATMPRGPSLPSTSVRPSPPQHADSLPHGHFLRHKGIPTYRLYQLQKKTEKTFSFFRRNNPLMISKQKNPFYRIRFFFFNHTTGRKKYSINCFINLKHIRGTFKIKYVIILVANARYDVTQTWIKISKVAEFSCRFSLRLNSSGFLLNISLPPWCCSCSA